MFERLLGRIAARLDKDGIPYMVIGGQAVLLYGEPRLTRDIDITLGISHHDLPALMKAVKSLRLKTLPENPAAFAAQTMVLPALHEPSGIRVDFVFSFSPYERQAIARAVAVPLGGRTVRFAAVEDLIILKIFAGRERDIEDVRKLLLKKPSMDSDYICTWLSEFDRALGEDFTGRFEKIR